jgi:hypothetical protein
MEISGVFMEQPARSLLLWRMFDSFEEDRQDILQGVYPQYRPSLELSGGARQASAKCRNC